MTPKIKTLVPWYGANRMLAHLVGEELRGCTWCGLPFAGGMSELLYIDSRTIVVNDLHLDVINLAEVIKDDLLREKLYSELPGVPFHPITLKTAQKYCLETRLEVKDIPDYVRAKNYFIASWQGRSGMSGTDKEFTGNLPVRWHADGGDSNVRYRSAIESLAAWGNIFVRCNFTTEDVFTWLVPVNDRSDCALYCDSPFPEGGELYSHSFTEQDHRALAKWLNRYNKIRLVMRFYDHPLVRELYRAEDGWIYKHSIGRKQSNAPADELLIRKR